MPAKKVGTRRSLDCVPRSARASSCEYGGLCCSWRRKRHRVWPQHRPRATLDRETRRYITADGFEVPCTLSCTPSRRNAQHRTQSRSILSACSCLINWLSRRHSSSTILTPRTTETQLANVAEANVKPSPLPHKIAKNVS